MGHAPFTTTALLSVVAHIGAGKSKHERKEMLKAFLKANPHYRFHNGDLLPR